MNTNKWIWLMGVILALGFVSCEERRMCDDDASCYSICATYENSVMMFACSAEGTCVCINAEELACDAAEVVEEGEKPHCEKVCSAVKPGSEGVCIKSLCECHTPEEEGSETENGSTSENDDTGTSENDDTGSP